MRHWPARELDTGGRLEAVAFALLLITTGWLLAGCCADDCRPPRPLPAETFAIPATHDFDAPEPWVEICIELPPDFDPNLIDLGTVRINGWVEPDPGFHNIVDLDTDGTPELQIRVTGFLFLQSLDCPTCGTGGGQVYYSAAGETDTAGGRREFFGEAPIFVANLPACYCAAGNSVQNAGFENDDNSDGEPDCWCYFDADDANDDGDWGEGGCITPTYDGTDSHTGTYSAKVTVGNGCNSVTDSGWKQKVKVTGGASKTLSVWVKASGLTAGAQTPADRVDVELAFYDQNGNLLALPAGAFIQAPIYADTGWTQISTSQFQVPQNAVLMQINLLLIVNAAPTANISAWFDDVSW